MIAAITSFFLSIDHLGLRSVKMPVLVVGLPIACFCSLILFTLLPALDMKKLKHYYFEYQDDKEKLAQLSMYSALQLYLDFLNLIYTIPHILNFRKN